MCLPSGDGFMDFDEFCKFLDDNNVNSEEEHKALFNEIDNDKDGKISLEDMTKAMKKSGIPLTNEDVNVVRKTYGNTIDLTGIIYYICALFLEQN